MPAAATLPLSDVTPLRLVLLRTARRLRRNSGGGLSPAQLSALAVLQRHGSLRLGDLSELEQISKSSVTRLIAKLEVLGLVRRTPNTEDGRSSYVTLTAEGHRRLEESNKRADAYLERQVDALTEEERRCLQAAMPVLERLLEVRA